MSKLKITQQIGKQVAFSTNQWNDTPNALLYVPDNYNENMPLICFFHGAGEATKTSVPDLNLLRSQGLPKLIESGMKIPFIVLTIQGQGWCPSPDVFIQAVKDLIDSGVNIDLSRIYATGLSSGGANSRAAIATHPEFFAAAVSMSPVSILSDISGFKERYIWFFHGDSDTTAPVGNSKHDAQLINASFPGHAELTIFSGGHCCWNTYYDTTYIDGTTGSNIYDWMMQYKLDAQGPVNVPPYTNQDTKKIVSVTIEYDDGTSQMIK